MGFNNWIDNFAMNRANNILNRQFRVGQTNPLSQLQFNLTRPNWISLSNPEDFELAARNNPVVKSAINLLATASSNAKKVAVDVNTGEIIPWTDKNPAIQKARELLTMRPNPLQSAKEFNFQGTFYLKVFGNRYAYANVPVGFADEVLDIMDINALWNLPSQFVNVKTTGKLFEQTTLDGIIEMYSLTNYHPVKEYLPHEILHFNEVNISSEMASVMGISKLEVLKYPITNTQRAFEAMNTILETRGMQGIISPKKIDGTGAPIPLSDTEKKAIDEDFKKDYGLLNNQNPFLLTPVPLEFIKTIMSSKELGIYEEFSNNAILIGNEFGVPPELIKTYIQGATYENQVQSVRRLYQDTAIPMVEDEDSYWSYRTGTRNHGFEIQSRWDHIPALQDAFKDKAAAINLKGRTAKDAFNERIITINEYRALIELPLLPGTEGDKYKAEEVKPTTESEEEE